jgi:hypothetical protein
MCCRFTLTISIRGGDGSHILANLLVLPDFCSQRPSQDTVLQVSWQLTAGRDDCRAAGSSRLQGRVQQLQSVSLLWLAGLLHFGFCGM